MSFAILALWYVMLERWACISSDMKLGRIIVQTLQKLISALNFMSWYFNVYEWMQPRRTNGCSWVLGSDKATFPSMHLIV